MDTNNVPATSTQTVTPNANANANANVEVEVVTATINKVSCYSRNIVIKDGDKDVKVTRTFVAINSEHATALENVAFGTATAIIRTAEKLFGVDAVDVAVCACIGCSAKFFIEDEYVVNVVIDDVDTAAVKDALMFYRELNA